MFSLGVLSLFNIMVLLLPPQPISDILTLMPLPFRARTVLLLMAVINVAVSMTFEQWGTQLVAGVIGGGMRWWRGRRRAREAKAYKAVEGGMR